MMGVIERGVPIPPRGGNTLYDWRSLEVGDSILVPTRAATRAGHQWAARHDRKFETRKMREKPYGFRVWRMA